MVHARVVLLHPHRDSGAESRRILPAEWRCAHVLLVAFGPNSNSLGCRCLPKVILSMQTQRLSFCRSSTRAPISNVASWMSQLSMHSTAIKGPEALIPLREIMRREAGHECTAAFEKM
jgi:hypothetical protein